MSNHLAALLLDLKRIVRDPAWRVFVLIDGARFDDLPVALIAAGIAHRSLYRTIGDTELVRAGPWLVDPYHLPDSEENVWAGERPESGEGAGEANIAADTRAALNEPFSNAIHREAGQTADPEAQLEAVLSVTGESSAAVFWIGNASLSEPALWQHLRTLNMVLVPKEYDAPDAAAPAAGEQTHEAMIFRHGDGNVLAEVLPVLEAAQFSRIFGPATALMFLAPDHPRTSGSPILRSVLPDDAPAAPPGLLKLSMDQMQGIENIRLGASRRETVKYLREHADEETAHLSDTQLYEEVVKIEARGFDLGFESSGAHMLFAFMAVTGSAEVIEGDEFAEYVQKSGKHPDDAVGSVFNGIISAAEADGRGEL